MPNSASARKRLRQSLVRKARNHSIKSTVRGQVKKVRKAVAAGDVETSEAEFRVAVKRLDKAAARGIMHPNAAARTKSRLSKAIKAVKQG
ncbi:MAG: 30S ribosomal protein S20 [Planctomycetota bacterium]